MVDIVDPATRCRMMSGIKSKNTRPEVALRKQLHALGFRYRLHCKDVPGHPDIVLPKWKTAIFVHGCFWHWHGCSLSKIPQSRREFWEAKLNSNRERDGRVLAELLRANWRVAIVRECAIRGPQKRSWEDVCGVLVNWIMNSQDKTLEIAAMDRKALLT